MIHNTSQATNTAPPSTTEHKSEHRVTQPHHHLLGHLLQTAAVQGQALYAGVARGQGGEHGQALMCGEVSVGEVNHFQLGQQVREEGGGKGRQLYTSQAETGEGGRSVDDGGGQVN